MKRMLKSLEGYHPRIREDWGPSSIKIGENARPPIQKHWVEDLESACLKTT